MRVLLACSRSVIPIIAAMTLVAGCAKGMPVDEDQVDAGSALIPGSDAAPPADTPPAVVCGDGTIGGDETCDGDDLGGATCAGLGYLGGTLGCDPLACAHDVSQCTSTQLLQNDDGQCDGAYIGCANDDGTSGNPQSLIECFDSGLAAPFDLGQVYYRIGDDFAAPGSLTLEVYGWSGSGPPGAAIASQPLTGGDLAIGEHTVALATPVSVPTATFCVGLTGTDEADGFRIGYSETSTVAGTSWLVAPTCEVPDLTLTAGVVGPGNWCLRATVARAP